MAANKRNAGLTSAIPRQSLNDEELVGKIIPISKLFLIFQFFVSLDQYFLYVRVSMIIPDSLQENTCL